MYKFLLILLFICNESYSQDLKKEIIQNSIDSIFKRFTNTPGLEIGIVSKGELIVKKNFGIANLDFKVALTDSTVFPIASISKQFTAYCILLLEKEGKLSLNDEVHKFIPQLPAYSRPILITDLLHQTSGLRDFIELLAVGGWRVEDIISINEALAMVYKQKGLNYLPHAKFQYSNTNYLLLGEIVKKVTGQSLSEYAKSKIFIPLHMNKTNFNESFRNVVSNLATSYYTAGKDNFSKALLNYSYTGPTGVYSTVADMSRWLTHILNLYQQHDPLFQKMITLKKLPSDADNNYASGFYISNKYKGILMLYHDGYDAAYRSYMACFPKENIGFILLANNEAINPKYYGTIISDILIKNKVQLDTSIKFRKIDEGTGTNISQRKKLIGTYEMNDGFVFEIKENKEFLNLILEGEPFHLYSQPNGELSVKQFDYNLLFNLDNSGSVLVRQNGEIKKGHKVNLVVHESLAPYLGKYYSEEVSQAYEIKLINSSLAVSHLKHGEIKITPFTRNVFRSGISFFDKVRFERSKKGQVIGFTYLGSRASGMFFKKMTGF